MDRPLGGVGPALRDSDADVLSRLAHVLHEMGLPCDCQDQVERAVSLFAELEARRVRRRLMEAARTRAVRLAGFIGYLDDLREGTAEQLGPDDCLLIADTFRTIGPHGLRRCCLPGDAGRAARGHRRGGDRPADLTFARSLPIRFVLCPGTKSARRPVPRVRRRQQPGEGCPVAPATPLPLLADGDRR